MTLIETVDAEGAVRAYLATVAGLTGPGGAIAAGVHQSPGRSPARGAVAEFDVSSRTPDDTEDEFRVSFRIKAIGGAAGAKAQAQLGGRRLVEALGEMSGNGVVVQTALGEWVRILTTADISGPAWTGDVGGESTYTVDATLCCQPATAP